MSTSYRTNVGLADRAYLLPNPDEYYPTVNEFLGRPSAIGWVAQSRRRLSASARPAAHEAVAAPVMYIGNFPVMRDDRGMISWGSECLPNL